MWCPTLFLGLVVPVALLGSYLLRGPSTPPKLFNKYSQPGRWYALKYGFAYVLLQLRKFWNSNRKPKKGCTSLQGTGYGVQSRTTIYEMDCPQQLPPNEPEAIDAVYFVAANRDNFYFIVGTARRAEKRINGFWYLRIPGVGLLMAPKLPDSNLMTNDDMEFSCTEGLLIEVKVPMVQWKISYNGLMKFEGDEDRTVNVQFLFDFISHAPHFDCDTDIPPAAMARAIAREEWSSQYFKDLKATHQTHHEQMGQLSGTINVEGVGEYVVKMDSMRDHTYANKRDWAQMNRYGLHSVYLEDGTKFCVGIISQLTLTRFEMGYVYTPEGKVHGVEWCDLDLPSHGDRGTPPTDYSFKFGAGGTEYLVECEVLYSPELYIGLNWEGRLLERMCRYTVNGKAGWGFAEWEYRHKGGRPTSIEGKKEPVPE